MLASPARGIGFDAALAAAESAPRVGGVRAALQARRTGDAQLPSATGHPELTLAPGLGTPGSGLALQVSVAQTWSADGLAPKRRQAATAERAVLAAQLRSVVLAQRLEIAQAWLELWTLQAVLQATERERALADQLAQHLQLAADQGAVLAADAQEARMFAAEVALRAVQAAGDVHVAGLRLARGLGQGPDAEPRAEGPLPAPALPTAAQWQALAHQADRLPDASEQRLEAMAVRRRAEEARAGHGSQWLVGGSLQRDADGSVLVLGTVGLRWAGLDRGQRAAAVAAADGARQDAEAEVRTLEGRHGLAAAWHEVEHARAEAGVVATHLLPAAEAQVRLREAALARGAGTVFDVLRARRQKLEAEQRGLETQAQRAWADVRAWLLAAAVVAGRGP